MGRLASFWAFRITRPDEGIPESNDKAAAVVVLWTKSYVASEYVREQAEIADGAKIFFAVSFEGDVDVLFRFWKPNAAAARDETARAARGSVVSSHR